MKYLLPFLLSAASAADQKKTVITTVGDSITEGVSISNMYKDRNYPI
jgi:lysophospholipase L1-like esterase